LLSTLLHVEGVRVATAKSYVTPPWSPETVTVVVSRVLLAGSDAVRVTEPTV
jgi:hypothetical protein